MFHFLRPCKYTNRKRLKVIASEYIAGDDCHGIPSYYQIVLSDGTIRNYFKYSKTKLRIKCKCGSAQYYD